MDKNVLKERQAEMRARQLKERREHDRRCKVDSVRIMRLAMMNLSIRQIAIEVGCSAAALYTDYRGVIGIGRERGGIVVRRVIYELAMAGDMEAVAYLHWHLNKELLNPPDVREVKEKSDTAKQRRDAKKGIENRSKVEKQWEEFKKLQDEEQALMQSESKSEDKSSGVARVYKVLF